MIDMMKEKLVSGGMKLMQSPAVAKLMESEKVGVLLEKAMSVPIKLSEGFRAKRERMTALFELATQQDLDEVKRSVARMEDLLHEIKNASSDLLDKTGAKAGGKEPVAR
jgi:tRNA(Phe) wybutosine-synthesizing methylase Tyw3